MQIRRMQDLFIWLMVSINTKPYIVFIIFLFLCGCGSGQIKNLPPEGIYYPISELVCKYPRQSGELEVIKNDSLKLIIFISDSSKMELHTDSFGIFQSNSGKNDEYPDINIKPDTLVILLFRNGLLTPDLLIKAYSVESKYIDHNGDTINFTNKTESKNIELLNIQRTENPKKYKNQKEIQSFEIILSFISADDELNPICLFDLILKSDKEYDESRLNEYIENAEIECLKYTGMQLFDF